ncbi:MAG TPA: YceI family protein [Saprospiraceae bacterium]|mgnify:CR=1 FL=1|nr:YceI family protein [Saprospiraceae bacterium]
MKKLSNRIWKICLISIVFILPYIFFKPILSGQTHFESKDQIVMILAGTSTLHDWEMRSTSATCEASFVLSSSGNLERLNTLTFSTPVKSLKSGKGGMDKNAYKALNAEEYSLIKATLKSAEISPINERTYNVDCIINLTIAGSTQETPLKTTAVINADQTISVQGQKVISMRDYGVDPPSFMLGTVRTGNDVTLTFNIKLFQK